MEKLQQLPVHVGIIMDGNRRWAKKRLLPAKAGHTAGAKVFKKIAKYCNNIGLQHLTVYAFSTENWNRTAEEVSALMALFKQYLENTLADFENENMKIKFLGDTSKFSPDIQKLITEIQDGSKDNAGMTLNIAMSYGGRDEIVHASKLLIEDIEHGRLQKEDISERIFGSKLYTENQPDVDLIIRTGGEYRLSNFLLWQAAYAELIVTDKFWPDFKPEDFDTAISEYFSRSKRFGK